METTTTETKRTKRTKKTKKTKKTTSNELARNRETLAEARRRIQMRGAPLAIIALFVVRFYRDQPWVLAAYVVPFLVLSIRWIVGYRRLKAELGLSGEYDELDENAGWGTKFFVILFGGFAAFFVLLFLFISVVGKH
jgi:hypothetical protein